MKRPALFLYAVLAAALAGAGWLWVENARLRTQLEETGVKPAPGQRTPARAMPGVQQLPQGGTPTVADTAKSPGGVSPKDHGGVRPAAADSGLLIVDNGDGKFTVSDPGGTWSQVMTAEQLRDFRRKMDSTIAAATTKLPGGPSWSPGRAAGPPDTMQHGDYSTAWASQAPDGGREWLQLKYPKSVEISEINIHETYNPGALAKVSAIMPDGSEKVIWEGTENQEEGVIERAVKVPPGIRSDQIRIELDTSRVPGWNEIDAVEIVGKDGSKQWASESTASSYFGQGRETGGDSLILETGAAE